MDEVFWARLPQGDRIAFVTCCAFATGRVGFEECTVIDDVEPCTWEDDYLRDRVIQKVKQSFPEFPEDRLSPQHPDWHKMALKFSLLLLTQDARSRVSVGALLQGQFDYN